jgi:hypothetical protein
MNVLIWREKNSAKLHQCAQYWKNPRDLNLRTIFNVKSTRARYYNLHNNVIIPELIMIVILNLFLIFKKSGKCPTIWWDGTSAICRSLRFLWFTPMHIHDKTPFRFCKELITCFHESWMYESRIFHEICYLYWSPLVWKSN